VSPSARAALTTEALSGPDLCTVAIRRARSSREVRKVWIYTSQVWIQGRVPVSGPQVPWACGPGPTRVAGVAGSRGRGRRHVGRGARRQPGGRGVCVL